MTMMMIDLSLEGEQMQLGDTCMQAWKGGPALIVTSGCEDAMVQRKS